MENIHEILNRHFLKKIGLIVLTFQLKLQHFNKNKSRMDGSDTSDYESGVLIDQYTSDLNLTVDAECLLAYPIAGDGFCSMWAGCRANSGINHDKVAFEINVILYS